MSKNLTLPLLLLALVVNSLTFSPRLYTAWAPVIVIAGACLSVAVLVYIALRWKTLAQTTTEKLLYGGNFLLIKASLLLFWFFTLRLLYRFHHDPSLQNNDLASLEWLLPALAYLAHIASLLIASLTIGFTLGYKTLANKRKDK